MSETSAPARFAVYQGEVSEFTVPIGRIAIGSRGHVEVLEADEGYAEALRGVIDGVNALDELRIKTAPPPEAEPGALYRRTVSRDDPDLLDALGEFLEQKYDLRIVRE
jgi:hypothetical protein